MSSEKNINLHSEDVGEILGFMPGWIFRWGTSVVFILILLTTVLSYYISYSDVLNAEITLTTMNPPVNLISKSNGKITSLFVSNGERIKEKQIIAVIENTADFRDVEYLLKACNTYMDQLKSTEQLPYFDLKENLKTGELTPDYLLLLKSIKDLNLYKEIKSSDKQILLLKKDLENYSGLLEKYRKQLSINSEELALFEKDYNRDLQLFKDGVIPARESESKKKEYLKALSSHEQIKIAVSNTSIQMNTTEKNILQLKMQAFEEETNLRNDLLKNLEALISEIIKWKQVYMIESPVNGKISFFSFWTLNQNIKTGDELFSIIPDQKQKFIGKCILPADNTGKLEIGQKVNIRLNNYPYAEYGMLEGIVSGISEVPNKDNYSIDVDLKKGLFTTYNKTLVYKEEMKGKADIITKNVSVMERVFFNFKKLVTQ